MPAPTDDASATDAADQRRQGGRGRGRGAPRLHGWRHPSVLAAASFSVYAGFAQFSATAALPDIAAAFGGAERTATSIAEQVGLSGTVLGIGLALIRGASVLSLPLNRQADRQGRKRLLLTTSLIGLGLTAVAAGMPTFWLFVLVLALARPLLSATNAVAGVIAAEEVATADRSKALAVITIGYAFGAGIPVILRGVTGGDIGFRLLFLLAVPMLLTLPLAGRLVEEPDRAARLGQDAATAKRLGRIPERLRGRMWLLAVLTFFVAYLTGPINTYVFLYAENVAGMPPSVLAIVAVPASLFGGLGLVVGVRLADRFGRIPTAMWSKVALAAAGILMYSAGAWGAVGGYVLTLFVGAAYAPAVAATAAEIFPTSIRATAAGWLTVSGTLGAVVGLFVFGVVFDASGSFATAAWVVCVPVAISTVGYRFLPETRGLELEESAPEVE